MTVIEELRNQHQADGSWRFPWMWEKCPVLWRRKPHPPDCSCKGKGCVPRKFSLGDVLNELERLGFTSVRMGRLGGEYYCMPYCGGDSISRIDQGKGKTRKDAALSALWEAVKGEASHG